MKQAFNTISHLIGNTPIRVLPHNSIRLHTKLEYTNFSGSIKDRPAYHILWNAINNGEITPETIVAESSSGNFAVSLAMLCARIGLRFIAVIDPNVSKDYEKLLRLISYRVIKVTQVDETGGYLLTRLEVVKTLCNSGEKVFWPNQYQNPGNFLSYYNSLGNEIIREFETLDYLFVGVSTGGTITGLSKRLKEHYVNIKVIGVDITGSIVFGGPPRKRYISGIGASIRSALIEEARIDDVVMVSQMDAVTGCRRLLSEHMLFTGASTGAVYTAIDRYFQDRHFTEKPNVVFICADKGYAYLDTIYDKSWNEWLAETEGEEFCKVL